MSSKINHPALYRALQFFVALFSYLPSWAGGVQGKLSADDQALIASILTTPEQQQLFAQMLPNDQRHAIAVLRTLQQARHTHPALMQAALLHDVAKSLGQPIIHRVLIVLFNAFWPAALHRLSSIPKDLQFNIQHSTFIINSISWWRRPFVIHAHHPVIGSIWAQETACDPLAVMLIARHQDELLDRLTEEEQLLTALQWADNSN